MNNFNVRIFGTPEKKQPVFTHRLVGNAVAVLLLGVAFSLVGNGHSNAAAQASFSSEKTCNYQANRTSYAFGCK